MKFCHSILTSKELTNTFYVFLCLLLLVTDKKMRKYMTGGGIYLFVFLFIIILFFYLFIIFLFYLFFYFFVYLIIYLFIYFCF